MASFVRASIWLLGILLWSIVSIGAREIPFLDYAEDTFYDTPFDATLEDQPLFEDGQSTLDVELLNSLEVQPYIGQEQSMFDVVSGVRGGKNPKTTFDVTQYGAAGDGAKDDVQAFDSAWKAACAAGGSVTITVPGGKSFLVSSVRFSGPCKSSQIIFNILGILVAPAKSAWRENSADSWLSFRGVSGLVVDGNSKGVINGQGNTWWQKNSDASSRPTALQFHGCNNLKVRGLNHKDSPRNHVSISNCKNAEVENLNMQSPGESPNTDGIDLSSSTNIQIHDSVIATGDDCIAINGGTSNVKIWGVQCGPGHGISIGSLGRNGGRDEVYGISVTDCTFIRSDNGVRIKTWQGGSGFAKNITFSNIKFVETNNPILIDQYYCPGSKCSEKSSAVKISDVKYTGLRGTSVGKKASVVLNCSKTIPCDNIVLEDIDIKPAGTAYPNKAICTNVKGHAEKFVNPDLRCVSS